MEGEQDSQVTMDTCGMSFTVTDGQKEHQWPKKQQQLGEEKKVTKGRYTQFDFGWQCKECDKISHIFDFNCKGCGRVRNPPSRDWLCHNCNQMIFASKDRCRKCNSRQGDWKCPCSVINFESRTACYKCKEKRPETARTEAYMIL